MAEQWQKFEENIERLLSALNYHNIERQVRTPIRLSRGAAKKRWPNKQGFPTPRFDFVARRPVTFRKVYVECKRFETNVPPSEVTDFLYRLDLCEIPFSKGIIAAWPQLSPDALKEAQGHGLRVWHGRVLERRLIAEALLRPSPLGVPIAAYRSVRYVKGIGG